MNSLEPGTYYHIYNRGNNREDIFREERNYLVAYIHTNPQTHGFVTDFRTWPYSSYHALTATMPTRLQRDDVVAWFGGVDELRAAQSNTIRSDVIEKLAPDDIG